jgi:hypothetical protein
MEYVAPTRPEKTFVLGQFDGGGGGGGVWSPSGSFIYSREARMSFVMSFCLSACISAAPKRLISVGLSWVGFYGNL